MANNEFSTATEELDPLVLTQILLPASISARLMDLAYLTGRTEHFFVAESLSETLGHLEEIYIGITLEEQELASSLGDPV